jgi:hypothetical protein
MHAQLLTYKCPHCAQPTDVDPTLAEQTITCPNPLCHKPFKLEVPSAQPMPNLVVAPGVAAEPVHQNRTVNGTASEVETDLLMVHPMMFRRYPFRSAAYGLLAVVGLGFLVVALIMGGWFLGLLGLAMVGFGMFKLVVLWGRMIDTSVTVTTKRTLLRTGVFHSQVTEIPHTQVADLQVHQTLLNRLLGVGDIALVTQAEDQKGILLMGLPHPGDIAQQIRTRCQT